MLIVEGPDGAGKTHLIKRLQDDFGMPVAPRVVSKNAEAMVDLVKWVEVNLKQGLIRMIYDRHRLISEPIYGPVLRSDMERGFDNMRWLSSMQQRLRALEPMVVFCLPPIDSVLANVVGDDDNRVVQDQIRTIYHLYFNLAASWPPQWKFVWDYTSDVPSYKGNTQYDLLRSDISHWLWKKGLYFGD